MPQAPRGASDREHNTEPVNEKRLHPGVEANSQDINSLDPVACEFSCFSSTSQPATEPSDSEAGTARTDDASTRTQQARRAARRAIAWVAHEAWPAIQGPLLDTAIETLNDPTAQALDSAAEWWHLARLGAFTWTVGRKVWQRRNRRRQ